MHAMHPLCLSRHLATQRRRDALSSPPGRPLGMPDMVTRLTDACHAPSVFVMTSGQPAPQHASHGVTRDQCMRVLIR